MSELGDWLFNAKTEAERAAAKCMCVWCDPDSSRNQVWQDTLTNDWYWDIKTGEWDEVDGGWVHIREWVNYCPMCGRKLGDD